MDTSVIEDLGLSNAEAKVYLALLEIGASKTGAIIDAVHLQSSTVYHVLGSLVEKGLATFVFSGKVKLYEAARPSTLMSFLDEKRKRLGAALPSLEEKATMGRQRHSARVYNGIKGLKAAYVDVLDSMKPGEEYYVFQMPKERLFSDEVVRFFRNYHLKRAEKGVRIKLLTIEGTQGRTEKIFGGLSHTQIKYVDEFLPNGLVIYKNKLLTLDWETVPVAFLIESKAVADSYKRFFEQRWKRAKR